MQTTANTIDIYKIRCIVFISANSTVQIHITFRSIVSSIALMHYVPTYAFPALEA